MDPSERKSLLDHIEMPGRWHVACFITVGCIGACLSLMGYGVYVWAAFGLIVLGATCYCMWKWREYRILVQLIELRKAENRAEVNAAYAGVRRPAEDRERARVEIARLTGKIRGLPESKEEDDSMDAPRH